MALAGVVLLAELKLLGGVGGQQGGTIVFLTLQVFGGHTPGELSVVGMYDGQVARLMRHFHRNETIVLLSLSVLRAVSLKSKTLFGGLQIKYRLRLLNIDLRAVPQITMQAMKVFHFHLLSLDRQQPKAHQQPYQQLFAYHHLPSYFGPLTLNVTHHFPSVVGEMAPSIVTEICPPQLHIHLQLFNNAGKLEIFS